MQSYLPSILIHFYKQIKAECQMRYATLLSIIHFPVPLSETINTHSKSGAKQLINPPPHCFQNMDGLLAALWNPQCKVWLLKATKDSAIQKFTSGNYTDFCVFCDSFTHRKFQIMALLHQGYKLSCFWSMMTRWKYENLKYTEASWTKKYSLGV